MIKGLLQYLPQDGKGRGAWFDIYDGNWARVGIGQGAARAVPGPVPGIVDGGLLDLVVTLAVGTRGTDCS